MTAGTSVAVALIGAYAMFRAKKVPPGREPVPLKDIWEENRLTRHEADLERDEKIALERRVANLATAAVVMWDYIIRLTDNWGSDRPMPKLSRTERAAIDRVLDEVTATEAP